MSEGGCAYCGEPRKGYPDRDARDFLGSSRRIDIRGCEEFLSQAGPLPPDSELSEACYKVREFERNEAGIIFRDLGDSDGGREMLPGKLRERLQALKEKIDLKDDAGRPVGRIAFDGFASVVLLHRATPAEGQGSQP